MICKPEPTFRLLDPLVGWENCIAPLYETHVVSFDSDVECNPTFGLNVTDNAWTTQCDNITLSLLNGRRGDSLNFTKPFPAGIELAGAPDAPLDDVGQLHMSFSSKTTLAACLEAMGGVEFDSTPKQLTPPGRMHTSMRHLVVKATHKGEVCFRSDICLVIERNANRDGAANQHETLAEYCLNRNLLQSKLSYDSNGSIQVNLRTNLRVPQQFLTSYMPPAWFARCCQTNEWYACGQKRMNNELWPFVRHRNRCTNEWCDLLPKLQAGYEVCNPIAIAVGCGRLAILSQHDKTIELFVWSIPDGRLCGRSICRYVADRQYSLSITRWRTIVAAHIGKCGKLRFDEFDLSGQQFRPINTEFTFEHPAEKLQLRAACGHMDELFIAAGAYEPRMPEQLFQVVAVRQIYRHSKSGCEPERLLDVEDHSEQFASSPQAFEEAIPSNGIRWEQDDCVAIDVSSTVEQANIEWINPAGRLVQCDYQPPRYPKFCGEILLGPLNSFQGRCVWHRVRAEVEGKEFGEFRIDVQSSDSDNPAELDPFFWQQVNENIDDFLIDQPAAKYLFLRVRIIGALRSPKLSRLRVDFPRVTSLNQLPAVYRQDPRAEDFTARFLSLFDSEIEELDHAIQHLPSRLHVDSASSELLPWLASFLAISLDDSWDDSQRRRILKAAPTLYGQRGTVQGLKSALAITVGIEPDQIVIVERAHRRSFGIVSHNVRLNQTRLYGKLESRLRLGSSPLGGAGLSTYGNPDEDFVRQDAHRFDVLIPPVQGDEAAIVRQIESVVENLKPAHTQHTLRMGGQGFVLGHRSAIGIDTKFVAPGEIVLANRSEAANEGIRLGEGVLRPGPNRPTSGLNLGVTSNIGIHTTLE